MVDINELYPGSHRDKVEELFFIETGYDPDHSGDDSAIVLEPGNTGVTYTIVHSVDDGKHILKYES